jgi:hypothetical protein
MSEQQLSDHFVPREPVRRRKLKPLDATKVDLGEPNDVQFWLGELGINLITLKDAVRRVGPSSNNIRRLVQGRRAGAVITPHHTEGMRWR